MDGRYLRILGTIELVDAGGRPVEVTATQRRILGRLAAGAPGSVSTDELVAAVWEGHPPASARQAVQNQVSRLRHAVGEDVIATTGDGYRLGVPTDADGLVSAAIDAEGLLADGKAAEAFDLINEVIGHGAFPSLAELGEAAVPYRKRLDAAVHAAQNTRLEAALELRRRTWALVEAERLVAMAPLDERRAALYARALTLVGRRSDALAAITRVRQSLRMNLGLDPGPDLTTAESDILHGGSEIDRVASPGSAPLFVGRDDELRRILQAVAQRKPARVRGERGSGVSRMLFEVRSRLISLGVRVILVRAEEHPHSATSLVEELLYELGIARDPAQNAISAFAEVAAGLNGDPPVAFIVDDVHFLGPSAWQALQAVVDAEYGGLILGGHRHMVDLDDQIDVLLRPLGAEAIGAMVRHWGVTDPEGAQLIFETSGGNPLAARLLAQSWDAMLVADPVAELPAFTDFLQQLVGELDTDRRHDLQLAAIAGDGYPVAAFEHLTWAHPPQPPTDLVGVDAGGALRFRHGAVRAHVYRTLPRGVLLDMHYALGIAARQVDAPAGTVARHLLAAAELDPDAAIGAAREAAQEASRLGAHADAADWLDQARQVAAQYPAGGAGFSPVGTPGGVGGGLLGGSGDGGVAAPEGGTAPAAEAPSAPAGNGAGTAIRLDIDYGDALRLMGHPEHMDQLIAATRRALDTGDDELIAAAGFALLQLGGSSPAGALDEELTALVGSVICGIDDPEIRAPVQAAASLAWSMTGHADEARALFDEAEGAARSAATRMAVLPFAYLALGLPADAERRAAAAEELVALAQAAGQPTALWEGRHLQFSVAIQRGDGAGARAALAEMESLIEAIGDVGRRWSTLYCAATVADLDGDLERAEELAERAYQTFAAVSPPRAAAAYYAHLLPLRLAQGRARELWPIIEALLADQPGVTAWHAAAAVVLASGLGIYDASREAGAAGSGAAGSGGGGAGSDGGVAAGGGVASDGAAVEAEREAARTHAALALDYAQQDFTYLAAHVIGGRAAALVGDRDLARRYLDRLEPWTDQVCWQGTCSYGPVAEIVAMLYSTVGDGDRAAAATARARDLSQSLRG